ncbi:Gfo/Idh/MocA family protein [Vibrio cholerae]|uniref:Gfo/Idh/MocA family protein n=1 Tax=Vibrio cholerae TaxID=666 RepID=UPI00164717B1|nr:Gfo/Idh/MocA family oxidoreductase [Vibrio cholerae]ELH0878889.1 Gfo/Idh/MocA family oxidoreductase [Vibrio cholerae]
MELKVGVVGCGRMGAKKSNRLQSILPSGWLPISHIESVIECEITEVHGVADVNQHSLDYVCEQYYVDNVCHTHMDLLQQGLDILTCATRTPTKKNIIMDSIRAGVKGIYVEKPLCNNLNDCKEILFEAEKNNVKLSYGVNRRFHDTYLKAKEIISSNKLGDLIEVRVDFGFAPLMWTHPHSLDLLNFFCGTPISVTAELDLLDVDISGLTSNILDGDPKIISAKVYYANGVIGRVSRCNGNLVTLMLEKGVIIVHGDGHSLQVMTKENESSDYFSCQSFMNPMASQGATVNAIEDLASSILNNENLKYISNNDIYFNMALIFGCVWSHLNGSVKIDVDNIPDDLIITGRTGEYFA